MMTIFEALSKPYEYIGQCDLLRRKCDDNEQYWHEMMRQKSKISIKSFLKLVDMSPLLDDGETARDWLEYNSNDPDFAAYKSKWGQNECIFVQVAGFEFIFVKK